jgi:hypothetical protein
MQTDTRAAILSEACRIVTSNRNVEYGEPENNFTRIGLLWTAYLRGRGLLDADLTTVDVAMLSLLIKVARVMESPAKADHWVDIAGYAACGAQCAGVNMESTP